MRGLRKTGTGGEERKRERRKAFRWVGGRASRRARFFLLSFFFFLQPRPLSFTFHKKKKQVKHPNILSFRDTHEAEERGETVIYLVTEPATPLLSTLEELSGGGSDDRGETTTAKMTAGQRSDFVAMGLHSVARAVSFLSSDCKLVHGNVCAAAVAVTPSLEWKLCCFDLMTEFASLSNLSPHSSLPPLPAGARPLLLNCGRGHYLPGEAQRGEWDALSASSGAPPWAVDAWGLGCLVAEAFAGRPLPAAPGALRDAAASLPPALVKDYQRLLASSPARRLDPAALAASPALRTPPVCALAFLDSLAVRDATEKDAFFRGGGDSGSYAPSADSLAAALPRFPPVVAQRRLLPALGAAVEFGGAPPSAVPPLLQIAASLGDDAFAASAAPLLARLFRCSADRGVRRCLLEGIPGFGARLPAAVVEGEVYPALTGTATGGGGGGGGGTNCAAAAGNALGCGFSDPSPYIRELTLKAMLTLAPKLQPRTLSQSLLKHLARAQVDAEGGIRANTTILLGNLAPLLEPATVQRGVLLNAFARALRDPFPPARAAGAAALASALHLHSPADVAAKGLPALAPVCADGDGRARRAALAAVDAVVAALKKNAAALDDKERKEEEEARAKGGGVGGGSAHFSPAAASPRGPARAAPDVLIVPPRPRAPLVAAAASTRRPSSGASAPASSSSRGPSLSVAAASDDGWNDNDDFSGDGGRATGHVAPPAADFDDDDNDDEWESMDAPAPPPPLRPRPSAANGGARRGGSAAGASANAARGGGGGGLKLGRSAAASAAAAPASAASRFSDLQL